MPSEAVAALCDRIRYHHRNRVFAMDQRKRADLALGSFLRMVLGWSPALDADARRAIADRATGLIKAVERGQGTADLAASGLSDVILAAVQARQPFDAVEAAAEKQMATLARQLPVWAEFAEATPRFGTLGLAIIVAEAGDLSAYPKKGHLWKRMGLALVDGVRQGGLPKNAAKAEWIAHGYNRERRSRMFTIGDSLIKGAGPYRDVYLARKAYEQAKATEAGLIVAPSAKIPAKRAAEFISDGHIHRRAQRYMEKRLLRDLWQAWKRCEANDVVPSEARQKSPRSATSSQEAA